MKPELLLPALAADLTPVALTEGSLPATTPTGPHVTDEEVEALREAIAASDADNTKRAYTSAWGSFTAWCASRGATPLPALPETLAFYLRLARRQNGALYSVATLNVHLSAIKRAHRERGLVAPTEHPLVYRTWKGIRRRRGVMQTGAAPLTADVLAQAIAALPMGARGTRDRALLQVGFAGAFRRSELAALRLADVGIHPRGIRLIAERRKTRPDEPAFIDIAAGTPPAEALLAWLDVLAASGAPLSLAPPRGHLGAVECGAARDTTGAALWRQVPQTLPTAHGLSAASIRLVVQRACARVPGLEGRWSAHSLRSGFATTAAEQGLSVMEIRQAGGWASVATVDRYVRVRRQFGSDAPRTRVLAALS